MAALKKLDQLSVKELTDIIYEIIGGTKDVLTARLRQALIDEDKDPDAYLFEIKPEIYQLIGQIQEEIDAMREQINRIGNKIDESVSQVKGQIDQFDAVVTQASVVGIDSLMKEQLPVDLLVKLHGQDCGCKNSGDRDAGYWSAVCVCVVGKSCGFDFTDEKYDNDYCYGLERKERNEETEVCYVPEVFVPVAPVTSTSISRTDQDNVGSASKPIAIDVKHL